MKKDKPVSRASRKKLSKNVKQAVKNMERHSEADLGILGDLSKACAKGDLESPIARAAVDLLVQIIRGDAVDSDADEIKPATIPQRIAAARILLRLKKSKAANDNNKEASPPVGIDVPPRAQSFEEWVNRAGEINRVLSE